MPIVRSELDAAPTSGEEGFRAIYVEVDQVRDVEPASVYSEIETRAEPAQKVVTLARDLFGEGVELARSCAARVARGLTNLPDAMRPDEFELQLAIKLDAEVGAVITKAHAGAQLQVSMRWRLTAGSEDGSE
jgi:hypothetical protein